MGLMLKRSGHPVARRKWRKNLPDPDGFRIGLGESGRRGSRRVNAFSGAGTGGRNNVL